MQIVPVALLGADLLRQRDAGLPALVAGAPEPLQAVARAGSIGIERPHQLRARLARRGQLLRQAGQSLGGVVGARHGRHGRDVVVPQRNGVEDAFDNPDLVRAAGVQHRRLPPHAAVAAVEGGLAIAEAVRLVDDPFPVHAGAQHEAYGRAAQLQLVAVVALLGVPVADLVQAEASTVAHIGISGSLGVVRRGREAIAPALEQIRVDVLDVQLGAAMVQAVALEHPWRIAEGPQRLLGAGRALAGLQLLAAALLLEGVVTQQAAGDFAVQGWVHESSGKKSPSRPERGMKQRNQQGRG
ncbi:hypothetical protein D9M68_690250 [compost metagenome]